MNGKACCILGVCCPPGSEEQVKALASALADGLDWKPGGPASIEVATWILTHFDLAPAGTLQSFKNIIAEMARKHPANPVL